MSEHDKDRNPEAGTETPAGNTQPGAPPWADEYEVAVVAHRGVMGRDTTIRVLVDHGVPPGARAGRAEAAAMEALRWHPAMVGFCDDARVTSVKLVDGRVWYGGLTLPGRGGGQSPGDPP